MVEVFEDVAGDGADAFGCHECGFFLRAACVFRNNPAGACQHVVVGEFEGEDVFVFDRVNDCVGVELFAEGFFGGA